MNEEEAKEICEELHSCIALGPGENSIALRRVNGLLSRIESDERGNTYVREKTLSVRESFQVWFSARRWNRRGDGGAQARSDIYMDVGKLSGACTTAFGANEAGA